MTRPNHLLSTIVLAAAAVMAAFVTSSCSDSKSYAELLSDENKAVNRFLADQRVIEEIPADSVFEYGPDAPYYRIDEENNIYMQVINPGSGEKAQEGQVVYFRSMRYALSLYYGEIDPSYWSGNSNSMLEDPTYFKYDDFTDYASQQWGSGLQQPLKFLPLNCDVNLVVKSQYGVTSEMAYVTPYLWRVRYFKSQI